MFLKLRPSSRSSKMRATVSTGSRRAQIAAPAGHPAGASQRCPVCRHRRRARIVNVRGVLAEVLPVEARPLRTPRA